MSKHPLNLRRFFIDVPQEINNFPCELALRDPFTVEHVRKVLRLKVGDQFIGIDATSSRPYLATILGYKGQSLDIQLDQATSTSNIVSPIQIHLGVALIKEQRWDLGIQKMTELGVHTITPLQTDHTVVQVKDADKKQVRWQRIARSAAEQSESWFIPTVHPAQSIEAFRKQVAQYPIKLLLLERGENRTPLKMHLPQYQSLLAESQNHPVHIAATIGPEGGWSDAEIEALTRLGFQPVSMGDKILRSETAAMSLISILNYEYTHATIDDTPAAS